MLLSLARQLQSWSGSILGGVGTATDMAMTLAQSRVQKPGPKAAVTKAAALLRDLRQAAGLSVDDLGRALELDDPSFMGLVESGKVGLPFDLILRMAAVLGRNDPIGFILQMTRSYNPGTWKTLEALGIGKLVVQAGREREFATSTAATTQRATFRTLTLRRRWPSPTPHSRPRWPFTLGCRARGRRPPPPKTRKKST
jgi:transcriptional regulator with XRE-family HTH domain